MEVAKANSSFTKWKPIEWMLALLFLVAPFYYHPHIGGEGLRLPNNIIVWMVAIIIVSYSLYKVAFYKVISRPEYFRYIIAFPILALISGFIAGVDEPMEWLFRLLFIWFGLLFFLSLFQHKLKQGRIDRLLWIVVLSAFVQAITGALQLNFSGSLPFWMPESLALWPYGFFQQMNNQASYQVTAIIAAIFLLTRPYINKGHLWKKVAIVLFFAVSAYVISLSGSRIGLLTILICVPLAIYGRKEHLFKNKKLTQMAALFFVLGSIGGSSGFVTVADKTMAINSGYSASARLGIYAVSLDLIKQKPFFGHGLGNFEKVWQYEKANFQNKHPDVELLGDYVTHPHNEIFFWLIEGGIIATAGIFILLVGIVLSMSGLNKHRKAIYLAMILPIMLHTQVELPFYISAVHWFLILLLLYVLMRVSSKTQLVSLSHSALVLLKLMSVLILIVGTLFLTHSMRASHQLGNLDNEASLWNLNAARINPYFSELVESFDMHSVLLLSRENGETDTLRDYILWAERTISRKPDPLRFTYLAMAYQQLGQEKGMCNTIKKGLSIYPTNDALRNGIEFCKE